MATLSLPFKLQTSVDRFGRALEVPQRLVALHPRTVGGSGNAAALAPAVTLAVIAAFEGFVEDILATTLFLQGHGLAQIAKRVSMNNPTVATFAAKMGGEVPIVRPQIGVGFEVRVWNIPKVGGRPATETIDWAEACRRADGWMEVRHCLSHGLVSGWRSEVWPAPLKGSVATTASSVLREKVDGKHSIGLTGAISCARIYTFGARHLADLVAIQLGERIDWSKFAKFPLLKEDSK